MTSRDQAVTIVSLSGLVAIFLVIAAGQLGFAYWWPTVLIVGVATVVGAFSLAEASFAKGFAIAVLLLVTCIA